MLKTRTALADGRQLIYYDRGTVPRRPLPDARRLPPRPSASRMRLDARTGEWVVVADHRQDRTFRPEPEDCPLCPSRDGRLTEIPDPEYDVVVFENRFPALTTGHTDDTGGDAGDESRRAPVPTSLLRSAPASGHCEVICFSSDHDASFADLKPDQARLVLEAWIDRSRDLGARAGVAQVFCFENRGPDMGVTLPHPHGQIYAFPFVTPRTGRMLDAALAYRREHGSNLFDDLVTAERAADDRVVTANDEWIAFVPYAARWPYEVHLYPMKRRPNLPDLTDAQRDAFVGIHLDLLRCFDRLFDSPAGYVSAWHQAPVGDAQAAEEFAVHLEMFTNRRSADRLKVLGGTEVGMDTFSNDIVPEHAAARLRELAGARPQRPETPTPWAVSRTRPHLYRSRTRSRCRGQGVSGVSAG